MGTVYHDAIIVTVAYETEIDVAAFRESMPDYLQRCLVGPITSPVNNYTTWLFAPDGSKEGWPASDEGEIWRERFLDLFWSYRDGSTPFDIVTVRYGSEYLNNHGKPHTQPHHPPRVKGSIDVQLRRRTA